MSKLVDDEDYDEDVDYDEDGVVEKVL